MKIRMLVSQAGPHICRRPGCVYDLPDVDEALRLIESEQAEAVDPLPVKPAPKAAPVEDVVDETAATAEPAPAAEPEPAGVEPAKPAVEPKPKRGKKK